MQQLSANDLERRAAMARMKAFALGLLVFVTVLYLAARWQEPRHPFFGYVRAFAEAAMVGALADWFAVTALFRHPLGVPIPHTAIIPHRKDQIGESLGDFVKENFLTKEVLHDRLDQAHVGQRLGVWLREPANARKTGNALADALRGSLDIVDDRDVGGSLQGLIERKIRDTPIAPLLGRAIDVAMDGGHHQRLLDTVLTGLGSFIDDNRVTFRERLANESPWWVPEGIDDRIYAKITTALHSFLADIATKPEHQVRKAIDRRILSFADRLRTDPGLIDKLESVKAELLAHRDVQAWLQSLWGEVKRSTRIATDDPDSELRRRIDTSLQRLGTRLADEPELQAKVDDWVDRAAGYIVDHYRGEVADIISSTVAKWDGKATAERLELQVGRDLQFIRINGTIVGGIAGLLIHTLSQWWF
jgi:uncharacterized membrane-anchored protein YjiN (DUF445 family)